MNIARQRISYKNAPRGFIAIEMLRAEAEQVAFADAIDGDDVGMNVRSMTSLLS